MASILLYVLVIAKRPSCTRHQETDLHAFKRIYDMWLLTTKSALAGWLYLSYLPDWLSFIATTKKLCRNASFWIPQAFRVNISVWHFDWKSLGVPHQCWFCGTVLPCRNEKLGRYFNTLIPKCSSQLSIDKKIWSDFDDR